jgi:F0F1-type ATP synthase assembly protein I
MTSLYILPPEICLSASDPIADMASEPLVENGNSVKSETRVAAFFEIVRFAGLPALIAGLAFGLSALWPIDSSGPSMDEIAKCAMILVGTAYMVLLIGAVLYQVQNETFSGRSALVSGACLALPVAAAFMGWAATSMKPEAAGFVFGGIALLIFWLVLMVFSFCAIYLFPRLVGVIPFGR